jgi:hypothetical protein
MDVCLRISCPDNHTLRHNPSTSGDILPWASMPLEIKLVGLKSNGMLFPELNSLREI